MDWTKLSGVAAMAAALIRAVTVGAAGMAALVGAVLIVGPALPGHVVAPWWVSSRPQIQAETNVCYVAARHYRNNFNYEPPPWCWNSSWFKGSDGHWDRPLPPHQQQGQRPPPDAPPPPGDAPPPPPGDAPPPPGDAP